MSSKTDKQNPIKVVSEFEPGGGQPNAIKKLSEGIYEGLPKQTLLGITGSGKTYTMAKIIEETQKPALILAPNKTLAGQLCNEFKEFFPENHVEFFISYYDYYQPESYIPHTDTFIEKTAKVNDQIDRLRHNATKSLFEYDDVVLVASVSCIYGLGMPEHYYDAAIKISVGMEIDMRKLMRNLVEIRYARNDIELTRTKFRVRGEILDIFQANEERILRVEFFGDEIERISYIEPVTGEVLEIIEEASIYPASHYMISDEDMEEKILQIEKELEERVHELKSIGKDLEAQRLIQRTRYDVEMMKEVGYCTGIENYSRILEGRAPGSAPKVLIDFFNRRYGEDGWICFIDESHMTLPQMRAMYNGDQSRKQVLVDYGFRLPCAKDNRPLKYDEINERVKRYIYVSATPGDEEMEECGGLDKDSKSIGETDSNAVAELVIRPTGLVDPEVEVKATKGQIDVLLDEIKSTCKKGEKIIVNTLTKRMAEDLSDYLSDQGVRTRYLHSDIKSLERIEILRDLRINEFDVLVGVNLLREGIDLPEVSLVCIMDADKEGYLRSYRTLIQMIGRAARNSNSRVILFADNETKSMKQALEETVRRREIQLAYNKEHGIVPKTIIKTLANPILDALQKAETVEEVLIEELDSKKKKLSKKELIRAIDKLEKDMKDEAAQLEFEKAALFRDQLKGLRELLEEKTV